MSMISIITPMGSGSSSCGYCTPPGERRVGSSFKKAGLVASRLSCGVYQRMIDRGWRRSGTYCYSPDSKRSCCPHYTIKLDALAFKPSRNQRKLINRWNRFIALGGDDMDVDQNRKTARPPKSSSVFCLTSDIHLSERAFLPKTDMSHHNFEVTLEHSSYTDEKYNLYVTYQTQIHHDPDNTPMNFGHFLVQITIDRIPPDHLPRQYGSYHQLYRLDGELVALGVIDILPWMRVQRVFHLSALREASLAKEIHDAGVPSMTALYMGYYIHTCAKMRYKGDYSPSYLADPVRLYAINNPNTRMYTLTLDQEDYSWHPLESCIPLLDQHHYATFTHPGHSLESPADIEVNESENNAEEIVEGVEATYSVGRKVVSLIPVTMTRQWEDEYDRKDIISCVRALGNDLAREIIFHM
ncbi:arginine-tRNA-protein transferase [Pisolithus marmoratus]|nr:arginine-tRNA-protein transferase [Pisolithus marmoratus]